MFGKQNQSYEIRQTPLPVYEIISQKIFFGISDGFPKGQGRIIDMADISVKKDGQFGGKVGQT